MQYLQHAELHKCLDYQWEGQSLNVCQPEVTATHLTSELNSAPCYSPETWLGQLSHVNVSPVNELLDNPPFPYSRLTAPVDFNWTLHHSHCPAPGRLSAVSRQMMDRFLKIGSSWHQWGYLTQLENVLYLYFLFYVLDYDHLSWIAFNLPSCVTLRLHYRKKKETECISASTNVAVKTIMHFFFIHLIFIHLNYISLLHLQEDVTIWDVTNI